jgi:hypothetical protein
MHFHHPQSPPRPPPPAPGSPAQHEPFALWLIAQDRFKFPSEEDLDADDPFSPARCALRLFLMEARRLFPGTGPDQNPTRAEWKLRMAVSLHGHQSWLCSAVLTRYSSLLVHSSRSTPSNCTGLPCGEQLKARPPRLTKPDSERMSSIALRGSRRAVGRSLCTDHGPNNRF